MSSAANTLPPWRRSSLPVALVGSLLLWASLPPLALGWLGWIAPLPWLLLVRMDALPGRRPYRAIYAAGLAFWLASVYWLCLPHPILTLGWLALSAYLAIYLPLFVGLSRVAVHRCSIPLWLAAPVVWTGLELARAHVLTGFLMASLAHTQVHWTMLIQISDIVGEYGVDFVVMLVAASIASLIPLSVLGSTRVADQLKGTTLAQLAVVIPAAIVLSATLAYGHWHLVKAQDLNAASLSKGPRLALIQGNSLADWKSDIDKQKQIMDEYVQLSEKSIVVAKTLGDGRAPNLIVWPETMYRNPLREFQPGFRFPSGVDRTTEEIASGDRRELARLSANLGTPLLVGIDRFKFLASDQVPTDRPDFRAYNSAALAEPGGQVVGTYDKVHLVMFGEYMPFSHWLPFLNQISSLTGSAEAGEGPVTLCTGGACFIPSICYETVIPHVIRRQVATLRINNQHLDALINLTNDAWYWGSSELDMHLTCGVFRAVETRLPLVIAANGGISAWIDHLGHVPPKCPRQQATFIIADIEPSRIQCFYVQYGDWFSGACLACCIVLAALGWKSRRILRKVIETRN